LEKKVERRKIKKSLVFVLDLSKQTKNKYAQLQKQPKQN